MITLNQVSYQINNYTLFEQLSGTIQKGKITGIVGISGSGKTTLLKLITGLLPLKQGEITLLGYSIKSGSKEILRKNIGYLLQHHALFLEETVAKNIFLNQPIDHIYLKTLLKELDLNLIGTEKAKELSGGMKKRVALARTLHHQPQLLLLDDPFSGLDPITTHRIFTVLKKYQMKHSGTILIASQEAKQLKNVCDHCYKIEDQKLKEVF